MIILGIETSCDDTCVAVVQIDSQGQAHILSNIVSSQEKVHQQWGGVVPNLAKREHSKNLVLVLSQALHKANILWKFKKDKEKSVERSVKRENKIKKIKQILATEEDLGEQTKEFLINYHKPQIDFIAVTEEPGLEPCLWTGKNFAYALSFFWNIPIIKVNHLHAHLALELLPLINNIENILPAIGLVVSGGHTQLILMEGLNSDQSKQPGIAYKQVGAYQYKILGETRDDAAGECFDKTARILGLGYPGGPAIAAEAAKFQILNSKFQIKLPRPMMYQKNYDFSFSGLKTAVLYHYTEFQNKDKEKNLHYIQEMCYHLQQAIIDVLITKTITAAKEFQVKAIIIGGGVAANQELRQQFSAIIKKELPQTALLLPQLKYSTDNAVMVAVQAYLKISSKIKCQMSKPQLKS
jgi:N6-L-threonylcarbamoyladenine synthase